MQMLANLWSLHAISILLIRRQPITIFVANFYMIVAYYVTY